MQTVPPTLRPSQLTCYRPHPPSPFVIITQLINRYSFYCLTEGGRPSRPRHCIKGVQPVPKAVHRSSCRDKHLPAVWFEPGSFHTTVCADLMPTMPSQHTRQLGYSWVMQLNSELLTSIMPTPRPRPMTPLETRSRIFCPATKHPFNDTIMPIFTIIYTEH